MAVSIKPSIVVMSGGEASVVLIVSTEATVDDDFEVKSVETKTSTTVEVSNVSMNSVVEVASKESEVSFLVEEDD